MKEDTRQAAYQTYKQSGLDLSPRHITTALVHFLFFFPRAATQTVVTSWSNICQTLMQAENGWWRDDDDAGNEKDDEDDFSLDDDDDDDEENAFWRSS
jgi:hypothetical protein